MLHRSYSPTSRPKKKKGEKKKRRGTPGLWNLPFRKLSKRGGRGRRKERMGFSSLLRLRDVISLTNWENERREEERKRGE